MAGNGDIEAHRATYNGVIALLKWGGVASLAIAFIVVVLLRG